MLKRLTLCGLFHLHKCKVADCMPNFYFIFILKDVYGNYYLFPFLFIFLFCYYFCLGNYCFVFWLCMYFFYYFFFALTVSPVDVICLIKKKKSSGGNLEGYSNRKRTMK